MPTTIISTNQTTTQTISFLWDLILLDGVTITTTTGSGIEASANTDTTIGVTVAGDIFSTGTAISLMADSNSDGTGTGDHRVFITATGTASAQGGSAVITYGSGNVVTNHGEIFAHSQFSHGIYNVGDNFALNNFGSISGRAGVFLTNAATQISEVNVMNAGVIQGTNNGIRTDGVALELVNIGVISAMDSDGGSFGLYLVDDNGTAGSEIHNSGTISGQTNSIRAWYNDNIVVNSGLLIGDVLFGTGNDTYDGRGGTVDGTVFGSIGDDTYITDDATLAIVENAVEGTDTVQSTVGWTLGDNFENLTLIGSGNVDGYGNVENNILTGNDGDNKLNGRGGADTLYGKAGDDRIEGGNGIDILFGGDGDDKL
ncbi:MAG: calcium-binding protein, partial [Rhodobacteraceae bacterium]|nr:calcium-binding protein [Paracoccaceae bacterium]